MDINHIANWLSNNWWILFLVIPWVISWFEREDAHDRLFNKDLEWKAVQDSRIPRDWCVEAMDEDGRCYVTIFSGPDSEDRARDYAYWMN